MPDVDRMQRPASSATAPYAAQPAVRSESGWRLAAATVALAAVVPATWFQVEGAQGLALPHVITLEESPAALSTEPGRTYEVRGHETLPPCDVTVRDVGSGDAVEVRPAAATASWTENVGGWVRSVEFTAPSGGVEVSCEQGLVFQMAPKPDLVATAFLGLPQVLPYALGAVGLLLFFGGRRR